MTMTETEKVHRRSVFFAVVNQVPGEIGTVLMRKQLLKGKTITIPALGIAISLSNEQIAMLNTMVLNRWYFTLGKFADELDPLVEMGFLDKRPNTFLVGFAYRRVH